MIGLILHQRYQILQLLAAGVFAQTYIAQDCTSPQRSKYVVKRFRTIGNEPNCLQAAQRRFTLESETLKQLTGHPQIPQFIDRFEEHREFYLVQEYIPGHPLSAELPLSKGCVKRWNETQVLELFSQILPILDYIHQKGIIHCDLKPNNIIRRSPDDRLFLIDFGGVQSQRPQPDTVQSPVSLATSPLGYLPAEQLTGYTHANSDLYALGMIAIQALTGVEPARLKENAETGEILWQHLCGKAENPISEKLDHVLTKMVKYHYKSRYQSAAEVMADLDLEQSENSPLSNPNEWNEADILELAKAFPKNPGKKPFPIVAGMGVGIATNGLLIAGGMYALLQAAPTPSETELLSTAEQAYQQGDLKQAISLAQSIPIQSNHYPEAQTSIREWSEQWNEAASQFKTVQKAFEEQRWLETALTAKKMPQIAYWQRKVDPILKQVEPKIKDDIQQSFRSAYTYAADRNFSQAIEILQQIPVDAPQGTLAEQKIAEYTEKQHIQAESLLQKAYNQAAKRNFEEALNYLRQISPDTATYTTALEKIEEYTEKQQVKQEALVAQRQDLNPGGQLREIVLEFKVRGNSSLP